MTRPANGNQPIPRLHRRTPAPKIGIVHLGLGAFFRAHGAVYIAEAMAASGGDWGILGVSLQSPHTRDHLAAQCCAYSAVELGADGTTAQLIEVVSEVLVASEDPQAVLARMADPAVRIVSLTVTEKGYCHDPGTGMLNLAHPDVVADLTNAWPRTAPGFLVRALQWRRDAGLRPFTVLSCDNLPENGRLVRGIVLELAARIDQSLADWIATEARFPCTMVDRIVPATKPEDIAMVATLIGFDDHAPVLHEPFRQWVVEDDFVDAARPDLAAAGVQLVRDVAPFEHMKLRMLNGTHSALAYLGYLAGYETIADTVADPGFASYIRRLWLSEIIPTVAAPTGVDLEVYADTLFARYANPAIRHRTWQIAMDGSQKLPQRLLATLAENHANGRPSPGLHLGVAAWMRYVGGTDEKGQGIDVKDPLADKLRALCDSAGTPDKKVAALLSVREVFPQKMATALLKPVTASYKQLLKSGSRISVGEFSSE